jgi:SAM-dependent methyltransferase
VPDRHYRIKGEYDIAKCNSCGLVFLNPMPNAEELANFYPKETYYSYNISYHDKRSPIKKILSKMLLLEYKIKDPKFDKPGKMLDLGCGNGWILYQWKERGWDTYGVEPGLLGAETGRRAGLNIHHGDLLSAKYPDSSFDYIRSNHSFEHIYNPTEVLEEIYRVLKPGGSLFIGVPNINSFNAKIFGKYWYYLGAPVHTFNYSDKTLPALLKKYNFSVEKISYNQHIGLLGSMQIVLNRKSGKTSDEGFLMNFLPFKFIAGILNKIMNFFKAGDCIEIIATKNWK